MKRYVSWLIVSVIVSILLISCGGNPAGVPAPPVEIPSPIVLKFVEPSQLQINMATVSPSISVSMAVGPDGEFTTEIAFGAYVQESVWHYLLSPALSGISAIEVPVDTVTTTFHETVDFGYVGADYLLNGTHDVKIDFADFDFDNNGAMEGCSGHTASLPICARMWIDDERYSAWVFATYPVVDDPATAENEAAPGTGRFKIYIAGNPGEPDGYGKVNYDFQDPLTLLSEAFIVLLYGDNTAMGLHERVTQHGAAATALKQVGYNQAIDNIADANPTNLIGIGDYLAQFREGYDYWSGSIHGLDATNPTVMGPLKNLDNQCALISTGNGTAEGDCTTVGGIDISVGALPFLTPVTFSDVAVPNDFPALPTF